MKNGTLRSYVTGFVLSIVLTLLAYIFVYIHIDSGHLDYTHNTLIAILISLALMQFYVQAVFFLHLGRDKGARWNLISFLFMVGVVFSIVVGSLWIMDNLDYHHGSDMNSKQKEQYMIEDEMPKAEHLENHQDDHGHE
ncbi:MAG: cytochrome o ubiquinol oxidase subunit IV [Patescibacteria group bacterium]